MARGLKFRGPGMAAWMKVTVEGTGWCLPQLLWLVLSQYHCSIVVFNIVDHDINSSYMLGYINDCCIGLYPNLLIPQTVWPH